VNVRLARSPDVPLGAAVLDDATAFVTSLGFEMRGELENGRFAWALYERPVRR
jgi:hypothetical protein